MTPPNNTFKGVRIREPPVSPKLDLDFPLSTVGPIPDDLDHISLPDSNVMPANFQSKGLGFSPVLSVGTDVIEEIPITSPDPLVVLSYEEIVKGMMSSERGDSSHFDNLFLDETIPVEKIIAPPKIIAPITCSVLMCMSKLAQSLLEEVDMPNANDRILPLDPNIKLTKTATGRVL
jgi:hypothetical protein